MTTFINYNNISANYFYLVLSYKYSYRDYIKAILSSNNIYFSFKLIYVSTTT